MPFLMRDWKQVAINYDNYIFNLNKTGTYLPLTKINPEAGVNYNHIHHILMDTYVGQSNHGQVAEAINIIPALVGATLVGIDKTNHLNINWVDKIKDFYNKKNGHHVYLNGYSSTTGHDWWYELMPNVFFYQLYALYPDADSEFETQFVSIAERQLGVLFQLGAKLHPWDTPNMNYRAFNLLTGQPNASSVPEPESAGSIAWLLYQAYIETQENKYLQGAALALDFLENWPTNPSYEIQLPYGILTAARMNAEEGTNYNISKMLDWAFSSGKGTLRRWGTIVGNWNGYDVSGLIGEANDEGNDYAFIMNGFQHAAALVPLVKYDKRYAKAIGKWILNLANASRLFYPNALPFENLHPSGINWAKQYNTDFSIPYESMKEFSNGKSPYATGDAVGGGWAATNLSLYSGSSVGYLASLIEKTNIESILQIDLNQTDFRGNNLFPTYLYYNPETSNQTVAMELPEGIFDIYDAISESMIMTQASGLVNFDMDAKDAKLLVIIPSSKNLEVKGRYYQTSQGEIIDYHYNYNYSNPLRIKAFTSNTSLIEVNKPVFVHCLIENQIGAVNYQWFQDGICIAATSEPSYLWTAPSQAGNYHLRCEVADEMHAVLSSELTITVAPEGEVPPVINNMNLSGSNPYFAGDTISIDVDFVPASALPDWTVDGGNLEQEETHTPKWILPASPGIYTIQLKLENHLGADEITYQVLVKNKNSVVLPENLIAYYPFNGDTQNYAQDDFHGISYNARSVEDARAKSNHAYAFSSNNQYIKIPNHKTLNFTDKIALSLWLKPDQFPEYEQYIVSHGSYEERYKLSITPEKKVRWTLRTSNQIVDVDDDMILQSGVFVHYTGIYTGYSLELYRNGNLAAFSPLTGHMGTTSKDITIARKDEQETRYNYLGAIDELRIYDTDLSPHDVEALPNLWDLSSGTNLMDISLPIKIYPNPFHSSFVVDCAGYQSIQSIEIYDSQGNICFSNKLSNCREIIVLEGFAPGMYLLRMTAGNGDHILRKIIKI